MTADTRKRGSGFYEAVMSEAEKEAFAAAHEVEGVDDEIALLRMKLQLALKEGPENMPVLLKAIGLLVRAVTARFRLSPGSAEQLEQSLRRVLEDAAAVAAGGPRGG